MTTFEYQKILQYFFKAIPKNRSRIGGYTLSLSGGIFHLDMSIDLHPLPQQPPIRIDSICLGVKHTYYCSVEEEIKAALWEVYREFKTALKTSESFLQPLEDFL